jgi:DNA-directed RNA polymerase subunit RPC12/RpoP
VTEKRPNESQPYSQTQTAYKTCPHCGHKLSPWQQVLLSVDRALVCKNCWYRIILEISEDQENESPSPDKE